MLFMTFIERSMSRSIVQSTRIERLASIVERTINFEFYRLVNKDQTLNKTRGTFGDCQNT
jgi:hypothetical protein